MFSRILWLTGFTISLGAGLFFADHALAYGATIVHFGVVALMTIFAAVFSLYLVKKNIS